MLEDSSANPVTAMPEHRYTVDIIVCVHNALDDVRRCFESIQQFSTLPYQLIVVDDGSDSETASYILGCQATTFIFNEQARGYTCAANQGLRVSQSPYVILLNSDTIVTPHWLERLVACAESHPKIGMVGPLSNTASWQSIPEIEYRGDWATNPLPTDLSVTQMAARIATYSARLYPRLPFLNGFCLLIKQSLIADIGYFDEDNFAQGYGEENDYSIRARQAGWELAVADDVYIYHAQSKSYSHERRKVLADQAFKKLVAKHGQTTIDEGIEICRHSRILRGIRTRAKLLLERWHLITQGQYYWRGKRVIIFLPIREIGGGGNVVMFEARVMQQMGIDVHILNFLHHKEGFEHCYSQFGIPVIYAAADVDVPNLCMEFDVVIATFNLCVDWLAPLADRPDAPRIAYYIQDFEPYFHVEKPAHYRWFWQSAWIRRRFASYYFRYDPEFRRAWISYLRIAQMIHFTKTVWNKTEVEKQIKCSCAAIGASYNAELFMPRVERPTMAQTPIHICAMIRPSSSRRGALRTMQVLRQIQHAYSEKIKITLFGVAENDPAFLALPHDFVYYHLGLQTPEQLAMLFNRVDIFVDFSNFQAMGLTAMEAMACGVAVIVPIWGGTTTFAVSQRNALVIDTISFNECYQALESLITDHGLRMKLAAQACQDIVHFYPEKTVYRLLDLLFGH